MRDRLWSDVSEGHSRARCHPSLPPGRARAMRVNHTYGRGGALAYLAVYDVHRAHAFGFTEPRTGIEPFLNLVTQVMSQEPYAGAKRVFWDRRQPLVPPRSDGLRPPDPRIPERGHGPHARPRLLAQPGGAFLLRCPAQVVSPNDFSDLKQVANRLPSIRRALQQHSTAVPVDVRDL